MDGRRGAREVVNIVDFDIQRKSNVMPDHFEISMIDKVLDISMRASKEIVDTHNDCSVGQEVLTQMRSQKAGAASD
jgi:hypothetical protein